MQGFAVDFVLSGSLGMAGKNVEAVLAISTSSFGTKYLAVLQQ